MTSEAANPQTKICRECKQSLPVSAFYRDTRGRFGVGSMCRDCYKEYKKANKERYTENDRVWREKNKDRKASINKAWREKNEERIRQTRHAWYLQNAEYKKTQQRIYASQNREKINKYLRKYTKTRKQTDPLYKLSKQVRTRITNDVHRRGAKKGGKSEKLLGIGFSEFLEFIGPPPFEYAQLDHICPCAQAQNEEELIKLQNYRNFRWMEAKENMTKSDKPTKEGEDMCLLLLGRQWVHQDSCARRHEK